MGADLNRAERLSSNAQFIQSHSDAINTNFSQVFANEVQQNHPQEANAILSATSGPMLAKQQQLADQFMQTHAKQLASQYQSNSAGVHLSVDRQKYLTQNYQTHANQLADQGAGTGAKFLQADALSSNVNSHIHANQNKLSGQKVQQTKHVDNMKSSSEKAIQSGKKYAKRGIGSHFIKEVEDIL